MIYYLSSTVPVKGDLPSRPFSFYGNIIDSGSVALAGIATLTLTDGSATIDLGATFNIAKYAGKDFTFKLTDSANRSILGYLSAASTNASTIVNTPGGSTQNWFSQDSGFDSNDASGYTYVISAPHIKQLWRTYNFWSYSSPISTTWAAVASPSTTWTAI